MGKKLYCILGETGSGKNTVEKELSYFLQILVNVCTREIRPGEEEGKDYYYVTLEEFNEKLESGEIVEYIEVETQKTCGRKNRYGLYKSELEKAEKNISVISLPLDRYLNLSDYIIKNKLKIEIIPIYLKTDREIRYEKLLERHAYDLDSHIEEIKRRMAVDDVLFYDIENNIKNLIVLQNNYNFDSLVEIVKYIMKDSFVLSREGGEEVCIEIR
ncbi:hypothetical protein [Cetobacterium sp.]|uniref:hypothetical protein n=1 Tax=Cetobacterium sp. TaxID=2071632 RepID=UPI003F3AFEA6